MAKHRQIRVSGFILLLVVLGFGISKSRTLRAEAKEVLSGVDVPAYAIRQVDNLDALPLNKEEKREVRELLKEKASIQAVFLDNGVEVVLINKNEKVCK